MVTSIGSTSGTQAAYAVTPKKITEQEAAATTVAAAGTQDTAAAATQSPESAAAARLGDQLGAQADAARVQRAVDESTAPTETEETASEAEATTDTAGARPAGGGAAPAGASASSETTATDYIAEADTNSDKTVSDEERAAYETKMREQTEDAAASSSARVAESRAAEVRAAYTPDEEPVSAVDTKA